MALTMSVPRKLLQINLAWAHYMLATVGPEAQQVYFSHRGAANVTIHVEASGRGDATERLTLGSRVQESQRVFKASKQANFPPAEVPLVLDDDVITDEDGAQWTVRKWSNDDGVGAVYKLTCVQTAPKQSGQLGQ